MRTAAARAVRRAKTQASIDLIKALFKDNPTLDLHDRNVGAKLQKLLTRWDQPLSMRTINDRLRPMRALEPKGKE
jgi:hypothetical protein